MSELRTYGSVEEAIATAQAELAPGEEIHLHYEECKADDEGNGCTCEPIIVEYRERATA